MREVVLDTETTGLDVGSGHRLVEIGCVELVNHVATGQTWSTYLDPGRSSASGAFEVHGLSASFLAEQPLFRDKAGELMAFLGDSPIIIHNAEFDLGFLDSELREAGLAPINQERVIDSLIMARRKYPGQPNSLDALLKRFEIDATSRQERHGALVDAQLLAEVYLELLGGRQSSLELDATIVRQPAHDTLVQRPSVVREPRPHEPTAEELARHEAFLEAHVTDPLWHRASD